MKSCDDQNLIERLKRQEKGAFDDFMAAYKHRLYAFIYHHVRREDVAYDIVQETCIQVYRHIQHYDINKPFTTWLFGIALNFCRSHARKSRLRTGPSLDTAMDSESGASYHDTLPSNEPNIEQAAISKIMLKRVSKDIDKLPEKLKTALIAFAVNGHSQEESALMLGITAKTLEMRVYRARKILTDKFSKYL
ncbi:MAG: RNA polymerase sigma factor [Rickettsiales bacterium]|nr:RNA polymerase sigma factor [Rickettsiales bacterium]